MPRESFETDTPWTTVFLTYWVYVLGIITAYSHILFLRFLYETPVVVPPGYAPLIDPSTLFFHLYFYGRISDCWYRPIASTPGAWIDIMERTGVVMFDNEIYTGRTTRCLNLGSYNYLGFAETTGTCLEADVASLHEYSPSTCSPRLTYGTTPVHQELEKLVADFVGKEDAVTFGMGYATNAHSLHAFVGKGGLIVSDTLNHASIVVGMRCSAAKVLIFRHNDPEHLEQILREAIVQGQPRSHRPWTKILIVVEGIYSMEGEILRLPEIIAIKKKYKAYLYVDEAHSIGALGPRGRGIVDYFKANPNDVDVLMGTFTKSFGSAGGYIASSKKMIDYIRATSFSSIYETSMPIPTVQQIITSLKIIAHEEEGKSRLNQLRQNSNYFRRRLTEEGFNVMGDFDSPIVPVKMCDPGKMAYFSRTCLENNIGAVVAGYPVTPLLKSRVRFCVSASHTIPDLEEAVRKMSIMGKMALITDENISRKNQTKLLGKQEQPHKNGTALDHDKTA